ncbi:MAG: YebC/PmpR family DNA-binding transcriptional regulator [Anaerolineae bacterium]
MSGHSKWSQIKRKKGVNDTRRGQLFTRLGRDVTLAVREGGSGDPESNFQLRLAIEKARGANMPRENIDRAIRRGMGDAGEGVQLEDITYEGYAPGGAAILVQTVTDNRNRAASEVRRIFTHGGGNMATSGSVAWMFDKKGILTIETEGRNAEEIELELIDLGVEDLLQSGKTIEAYVEPKELRRVREELHKRNIPVENAEISMLPKTPAAVATEDAIKAMRLIEQLEELDDVQKVTSNLDINDELIAKFENIKEHA